MDVMKPNSYIAMFSDWDDNPTMRRSVNRLRDQLPLFRRLAISQASLLPRKTILFFANRKIHPVLIQRTVKMFKFLKSSSTPLALRILHFLQHLVLLPAFPIALLCLFGMAVFRTGSLFLLPSPWVFSSISNVILLNKERGATAKGELSKRRYLRLQVLKLAWTVLFFIPIFVAFFTMKGMGFAMLAIFMHYTWFWGSIVWFNGLHW